MQMAIVSIANSTNRSNLRTLTSLAYAQRTLKPGIDMLTQSAATLSYDRRTIILHWLTALLVIGLWLVGQTVDWFPKGLVRTSARSTHIVCGALLGVLIVYRVWWRVTGGKRLPPADEGLLRTLSTFTHRALYLLVCLTVALGITNAWIRGDSIFGLFRIPSFAPLDKALRDSVEEYHGLSANILIALAGIHALAGLFHHYILKDGVLPRMIRF